MEMERIKPEANLYIRIIKIRVPNPKARFSNEPKSAAPCPPPKLLIETEIKVRPITVTTVPVTRLEGKI